MDDKLSQQSTLTVGIGFLSCICLCFHRCMYVYLCLYLYQYVRQRRMLWEHTLCNMFFFCGSSIWLMTSTGWALSTGGVALSLARMWQLSSIPLRFRSTGWSALGCINAKQQLCVKQQLLEPQMLQVLSPSQHYVKQLQLGKQIPTVRVLWHYKYSQCLITSPNCNNEFEFSSNG